LPKGPQPQAEAAVEAMASVAAVITVAIVFIFFLQENNLLNRLKKIVVCEDGKNNIRKRLNKQ
jgi:hypothetical protein